MRATGGDRRQIREVQRSLTGAQDTQIARVVALVDGLADRTAADALIAPLRPRLAQLRPPRPLRLARLVFLPLDTVIVAATRWRPGQPAVPRTALTPLTDAVRAAEPALVVAAESLVSGRNTDDAAMIAQAGGMLWPAASRALLAAARPASWTEQGLPEAAFPLLARAVGGLLGQAIALRRLLEDARHGLPPADPAINAILAGVSPHGASDMAVAILLGELPDPAPIAARLAAELAHPTDLALRAGAERLAGALLEQLDQSGLLAATELASAGGEVRRAASLLDAVDRPGASTARRQQARDLRSRLDAGSRARFASRLEQEFTGPLRAQLAAGGEVATGELEAAARALRQLEAAGRQVGGTSFYDALVRRTTEDVRGLAEGPSLTRADKVRMVELLAGPNEALALLGG